MASRFNTFIEDVKKNKDFNLLEIEIPSKGENIFSYKGSIIGEENDSKFFNLARKHGFLALANQVDVWKSEEYYQIFIEKINHKSNFQFNIQF